MTGCKKIDMDTWARREHYEYYTKQLKVVGKMPPLFQFVSIVHIIHFT